MTLQLLAPMAFLEPDALLETPVTAMAVGLRIGVGHTRVRNLRFRVEQRTFSLL
jgi:hypothetical protein